MGYFDDLETPVEDIAVGFGLPNGEFEVTITEVTLVEKKDDKGQAVVIKFTVDPGNDNAGKSHQQWVSVPSRAVHGDKLMTFASMMKQWLMNIGVPEGMVGEFDATNVDHTDAIVGNTGILKLRPQKNNPNYQNASFFLDEDNAGGMPESGASDVSVPSAKPTPEAAEPEFDLSKF